MNIVEKAATGAVTAASSRLRSVVLTGGSDAATAVIRKGGASGTVILSVKAATATTVPVPLSGSWCEGGIHVTLTGTGPTCTVEWE